VENQTDKSLPALQQYSLYKRENKSNPPAPFRKGGINFYSSFVKGGGEFTSWRILYTRENILFLLC
jgi:hypothetical protein